MEQTTEYTNMYIGGAHTNTSLRTWSMEAATESGKIVANHILTKYNLEKCYHYVFDNRYLHQIDDILYAMKCPNIIDVISSCIVLLIIIKLYEHKYTITKSIKNQSYFSKIINTIKRIIK